MAVKILNLAGIAQLVEQGFCKPQVGSSNLSAGTIRDVARLMQKAQKRGL